MGLSEHVFLQRLVVQIEIATAMPTHGVHVSVCNNGGCVSVVWCGDCSLGAEDACERFIMNRSCPGMWIPDELVRRAVGLDVDRGVLFSLCSWSKRLGAISVRGATWPQ